jgi:methylated-DNA-[protein]-cysteine S-methyltransferase
MTAPDTMPQDLDARFRAQAADEGLLDVAYDVTDSPIGPLLVAATERGLCRIAFDPEPDRAVDELARVFGARVLRSPKPLDETRRELDDYFEGRLRTFGLKVDLTAVTDFHRTVLKELARVPYGETATYGGLATKLGRPSAARAIGGAMNRNPIPIVLPCHRVVGAHGELTGYAGGLERKVALLELEGALPHGLFE